MADEVPTYQSATRDVLLTSAKVICKYQTGVHDGAEAFWFVGKRTCEQDMNRECEIAPRI